MALRRGPRLHSHRVPPEGWLTRQQKEPSVVKYSYRAKKNQKKQREKNKKTLCESVCSLPDGFLGVLKTCPGFNKLYPKVQFGGELWKNGQRFIPAAPDSMSRTVTNHIVNYVAELNVNTSRLCRNHVRDKCSFFMVLADLRKKFNTSFLPKEIMISESIQERRLTDLLSRYI